MRIASAVRATRALTGGIVAAHAAVAAKRASFNPLVQGSTPWRPTSCCFMSFGGGSVESFDVYGGTDPITRTTPAHEAVLAGHGDLGAGVEDPAIKVDVELHRREAVRR